MSADTSKANNDEAPLELPEVAVPAFDTANRRAVASFRWHARPEHQTALYRLRQRAEAVGVATAAALGVVWSLAQVLGH